MVSLKRKMQPSWTIYLFKVSFSLYMLVSVIVLINLLIAMMSDTYQNIQSQSDIEWKYGLSKLIRKMQKTQTAPSPLNLVTSWIAYLGKPCKIRNEGRKPGVMRLFTGRSFIQDNGISPQQCDAIHFPLLRTSPLESQLSLKDSTRIENIVDWDIVRRKYRVRFGSEIEKPPSEDASTADGNA
ncbi:transient receptor potential cation channel subfamily M member 2-like [Hylaeus anthracinus]|uniref:transient receptor potential cation channel subfamily M member 2-like n=1 Tax=Hylaeus volcanicus TaxID=313075 RepID=UPI0023B7A7DF|nr:transient receptor potential cation channel subfamily M member 2-like [Hylaeus volcanicus]XP_054002793.1 transient receptor potential cation channel subfamily M member 2-like [Hylaeus anthracinus]